MTVPQLFIEAMKMRNRRRLPAFAHTKLYIHSTTSITHNDDSNFHKRNLITFYFHESSSGRDRSEAEALRLWPSCVAICVAHTPNVYTERFQANEWLFVLGNRSGFSFVPVRSMCAPYCVRPQTIPDRTTVAPTLAVFVCNPVVVMRIIKMMKCKTK